VIEQIIMSRAKVVIVPPGLVQCLEGRFSVVIEQIIMGRANVAIVPRGLCVSLCLLMSLCRASVCLSTSRYHVQDFLWVCSMFCTRVEG
jgi:hypothetical protein